MLAAQTPIQTRSDYSDNRGHNRPLARPSFAERLLERAQQTSMFCLGIDPTPALLQQWSLPPDASGLAEFGKRVLDACAGVVSIIKPQVAYFEAFGPAGAQVLQDLIVQARARDIIVIADGKRSDIGSTATAYAEAWLGEDSPYNADAITVVPWFGTGALFPVLDRAKQHGCAVFVVVRSSNPEGQLLQSATVDAPAAGGDARRHTLSNHIAEEIEQYNASGAASDPQHSVGANGSKLGAVGAVIGATLQGIRQTAELMPSALMLTPGIGAQGATFDDLARLLPAACLKRTIPTAARSVLGRGPDGTSLAAALLQHRDDTLRLSEAAA